MKVVFGDPAGPAVQLEKRIQPIPPERGRDEGCLGDPLSELESGNPARKADPQPIPPERGL